MSNKLPHLKTPAGKVVRVRLMPQEIMACIDIVRATKQPVVDGLSLDGVVRAGITSMCVTLWRAGLLKQRDGFEFADMIKPFVQARLSRKVQLAHTMNLAELQAQSKDIQLYGGLDIEQPELTEDDIVTSRERTRETLRAEGYSEPQIVKMMGSGRPTGGPQVRNKSALRLAELSLKESADPINLSANEKRELRQLRAEKARQPR